MRICTIIDFNTDINNKCNDFIAFIRACIAYLKYMLFCMFLMILAFVIVHTNKNNIRFAVMIIFIVFTIIIISTMYFFKQIFIKSKSFWQ